MSKCRFLNSTSNETQVAYIEPQVAAPYPQVASLALGEHSDANCVIVTQLAVLLTQLAALVTQVASWVTQVAS